MDTPPTRLPHEPKQRQPNRKLKSPSERKPNTWSSHVKQYCEDNNVKHRDALRTQACRETYYKKKTVQEN